MPFEYTDVVQLWRYYQGGGMSIGHLPDAGGVNDQSSWLLTAFSLMSNFEAALKKE